LRAKLKAKLQTQLNSGIDPEVLAMGTELAVFHIEAGARKFGDFAKAMMADLGLSVNDAKRFLRGWYNGARDMMEDAGAPVADMDSPDQVRAGLEKLATESTRGTLQSEEKGNASATETGRTGANDRAGDEGSRAGIVSGAEAERSAGNGAEASGRGSDGELPHGAQPSDRRKSNDPPHHKSGKMAALRSEAARTAIDQAVEFEPRAGEPTTAQVLGT
jgi:hypothetical protein